MVKQITTFKEIYFRYLQIFKEEIKDEFIEQLFNENKSDRIEVTTAHTKENKRGI